MNMLLPVMWLRVVFACLIVTSHFWFMLTSLLTQTLEFLLTKLLLNQFPLALSRDVLHDLTDPHMPLSINPLSHLSLESGFIVCLYIYFNHAFLTAFSFPISACSISPCLSPSNAKLLHFESYRKPLSTSD